MFSGTLARMKVLHLWVSCFGALVACGGNQADAPAPATPPTGAPASTSPAPTSTAPSSGDGQICGTRGAAPCPSGMFCNYKPGDECGAADAAGRCTSRPAACPQIVAPVCGCDGKPYGNGCKANAAGTGVLKDGSC